MAGVYIVTPLLCKIQTVYRMYADLTGRGALAVGPPGRRKHTGLRSLLRGAGQLHTHTVAAARNTGKHSTAVRHDDCRALLG
jgi:hypothetical protein